MTTQQAVEMALDLYRLDAGLPFQAHRGMGDICNRALAKFRRKANRPRVLRVPR